MTGTLHFQQAFDASASAVFGALTEDDALRTWFAEHASVSLPEGRYDFWGRFTPETPDRRRGRHAVQLAVPGRRLRYAWRLRGADTTVEIRLTERDGRCVLGLWHREIPPIDDSAPGCYAMDDAWSLWLESLRRYLAGKPLVRCDFSAVTGGDIDHAVDIAAPRATVWNALTDPRERTRWIARDVQTPLTMGGVWIDWGPFGRLRVVDVTPPETLVLRWETDAHTTTVTLNLEQVRPNETRLTLAHTGFRPTDRSDGHELGWISYLGWIQSMVEFGIEWLPPLKELARDVSLYYAASIWARQEELLNDSDEAWD